MKVLLIGQLPKEIGGNYTTGAANVVYELSKYNIHNVAYYTYGTNITDKAAVNASSYMYQYIGYKLRPMRIIANAVCHPVMTIRHLLHYHKVDNQNVLRFSFYEDNIRAAINRVQPDLIHVNSIANLSPVRFAIGKKNIPILLTCHGIFYRGDENDIANRDMILRNIKMADAYSGLTHESLEEYETILGVPKDRVAIVPNGVDCKKFFYSPDERLKIRKEFGVSDKCKIFITVASVQERKGQLVFLKQLSKLNIDFQYWIVGQGPDEDAILKYVQEKGLQDQLRLLGYKNANELYKYYSAADIYAHPSWKEGQALSELEANATGLRTIVNKAIVGTVTIDVTSDDYYILDFDKVDADSLIEWILQENTARSSRTSFDWSVIAEQYASLYYEITSKHKKSTF